MAHRGRELRQMKIRVTVTAIMGHVVSHELHFIHRTLHEVLEFDHKPSNREIRKAIEELKKYENYTFQAFKVIKREIIAS
jgi:hypothetical protein